MGWERVCAGLAAAALLCACGGDEFAEGSGTGGQSSGGVGNTGGAATGGSSSGGAGGTAGSASGGASGSGGSSGSAGASGGAGGSTGGSGGSSGGSGGSTGGTGGSSGGTGGSGGSAGAPVGCGNAHPSAALLYTTFDNATAIISPAVIKNGTGIVKNGSFAEGFCASQAYKVDAVGAYAKFLAPQNIDLAKGTLDFHFKPLFDKNDGKGHRLIGVPGLMQLAKNAQNQLVFGIGSTPIASVSSSNLMFVQSKWVRVTVAWDTTASPIAQIYFDGALAPLTASAAGPITPPALVGELWVGAFASSDADFALGVFDDLKVYGSPQAP